jgi:hypothetical protein
VLALALRRLRVGWAHRSVRHDVAVGAPPLDVPAPSNCSWYSDAYSPPSRSRSRCEPDSATRPRSMTKMLSALTMVYSRCAMAMVVRDPIRASSAFCTSRSLAVSSAEVASSTSSCDALGRP